MDESLGDRLARGEQAAFAELFDACANRLHDYLTRRLGSREDASDVVQETFIRLARSRRRLVRVENVTAYVFAIARNEAVRFTTRGAARRLRDAASASSLDAATTGESPSADLPDVTAALARLSDAEREIVELKIYAGLTFREIAVVTDAPQGTVATRYRTALERLRQWLAKEIT
jgi:RNA polymerase sigma-70 factor (ECF subfamily)